MYVYIQLNHFAAHLNLTQHQLYSNKNYMKKLKVIQQL